MPEFAARSGTVGIGNTHRPMLPCCIACRMAVATKSPWSSSLSVLWPFFEPFLEVSTMYRTLNDQLEEFVDDCSLSDVLIALSEVCSWRATDSHDDPARREWQKCATHVEAAASVAYRVGL